MAVPLSFLPLLLLLLLRIGLVVVGESRFICFDIPLLLATKKQIHALPITDSPTIDNTIVSHLQVRMMTTAASKDDVIEDEKCT